MFTKVLAQVEGWAGPLTQVGVSGVVLFWFMFRSETRMTELKESMDTLARAHLLSVVANREASTVVREQAEQMIKEIEARQAKKRR